MSKILVTGSTGNVGSRLVRILTSQGVPVRALVRNSGKANFGPGVEVVTGDLADKNSLDKALDGVSKVYSLASGVGQDLEANEASLIDAAKNAKVQLLVKHSVQGAQYKATDIPRWHRAGEERIEASGIPYVFLRPGSFDSNSFAWITTVKSQDTVYGALGETSLPAIDPQDIAEVAAVVLTKPGHAGKVYELTGPESLTTQQQVDLLAQAIGRPLKYVNVPDDSARNAMIGMGMPERYVDAMIGLIQTLRGIGRVEPTSDVKSVLGREPGAYAQWAKANATAFAKDTAQAQA